MNLIKKEQLTKINGAKTLNDAVIIFANSEEYLTYITYNPVTGKVFEIFETSDGKALDKIRGEDGNFKPWFKK